MGASLCAAPAGTDCSLEPAEAIAVAHDVDELRIRKDAVFETDPPWTGELRGKSSLALIPTCRGDEAPSLLGL